MNRLKIDVGAACVDSSLDQSVRKVLKLQFGVLAGLLVLNVVCAATIAGLSWLDMLASTTFGAMLALVGTWLNARSVRRTPMNAAMGAGMVAIFSGLLNKLFIVGGGIAFGLIALELNPFWLVTSYIIVQLATAWTMVQSDPLTPLGGVDDSATPER